MAAMGGMGMGMPGGDPTMGAVDMGGMGVPSMPTNSEAMLQAMLAVLGKWEGQEAQLAGEQASLMETLMLIASAQPPSAAEAALLGGDPAGYGMDPTGMV